MQVIKQLEKDIKMPTNIKKNLFYFVQKEWFT